jgi:hypothetical protein
MTDVTGTWRYTYRVLRGQAVRTRGRVTFLAEEAAFSRQWQSKKASAGTNEHVVMKEVGELMQEILKLWEARLPMQSVARLNGKVSWTSPVN